MTSVHLMLHLTSDGGGVETITVLANFTPPAFKMPLHTSLKESNGGNTRAGKEFHLSIMRQTKNPSEYKRRNTTNCKTVTHDVQERR